MKKIFLILIFSLNINLFSQKLYKVTAISALIIRKEPEINGKKIDKLNLNETVKIIGTTNNSFTFENISGYWVEIETKDFKNGFVFNGFLKPLVNNRIEYKLRRNKEYLSQELIAKVNGKNFILINFKYKICFDIQEIQDYNNNNNGYEEILLKNINACGGNGACNSLFAYSFNGTKFIESKQI